jgi:hypothetical protein
MFWSNVPAIQNSKAHAIVDSKANEQACFASICARKAGLFSCYFGIYCRSTVNRAVDS